MTRKSSTLTLSLILLAVALAPAAAFAGGYESVSAIAGPAETGEDSYSSVNALVGEAPSDPSTLSSTQSDRSSLTAIVGADGVPEAIPEPLSVTAEGDGLNSTDVAVGALIGAGLILMMLAAAVLVARHRRTTAESRA